MSSGISPIEPLTRVARRARTAARRLAVLPVETRNAILLAAAAEIENRCKEILAANERDCEAAQEEIKACRMTQALFDRLQTTARGVSDMAAKVRAVAQLPDPLGQRFAATEIDEKLMLQKVSCPLGVIGIIFESRPDVIPQVSALCLKSGNAVLLKGGQEAALSNEVLTSIWRDTLARFSEDLIESVSLLRTRDDVNAMLELRGSIDLIVPRGSKDF